MEHQYKSKELKQEVMKPLPFWATESVSTWNIIRGGGRGEEGGLFIRPLPPISDCSYTWRS